ncbi:MAG: membrane protein YczE [Ilumatobacteraceae bacterium]
MTTPSVRHEYDAQVPNFFTAPLSDRPLQRIVRCTGGLALFGIGISFVVHARLGLAPWDVFHQGLSEHLNIPIGTIIILTSLVVMLLWIPLDQPVGLGTILNAFLIGLTVNIVLPLLPEVHDIAVRILLMCVGIGIVAIASGLYIGSGLGPGPRDGLMMGLNIKGYRISRARTFVEISVLIVGIALGGQAGIGTVLFALGIGPLVARTLPMLQMTMQPIDSLANSDTTQT